MFEIESLLLLLTVLGEILGAGLLLYLLVFLLGKYTVVYQVLPSGRREKIGYLWQIHGEYILYDSLLPLFNGSKIGFVRDHEIRPLVMNVQHNKVQKTLGTFTDDGRVIDLNGILVGSCEDVDARKTGVVSPSGEKIGFVRGSLRAKSDLTARGAGFSVLREPESASRYAFDVRVGVKDLMLPAALIYIVLFYPLMLITESFTEPASMSYMLVMFLYYVLIIGILYVIKYEKTMSNESLDYFIGLIDRNVGVGAMNWLIIIASVVALQVAPVPAFPLFVVTLVGFAFNMTCFNGEWHLEEPSSSWNGRIPVAPQAPAASSAPSANHVTRTFSWAPIMAAKGIQDCKEELELSFSETDFSGVDSLVRKANPFRSEGPIQSEEDCAKRAREVLAGAQTADGCEETAIAKILSSAYQLCMRYGLADFEIFDLVLAFVQHHVQYVVDEESESIGKVDEYFRFASETLYDGEGDCDCKSVLAYRLFDKLGVDVDLVTVKSGKASYNNHVAIVLRNKPTATIPLPPGFVEIAPGKGVYCEPTGQGFKPGDIPKGVDVNSLVVMS